MSFGIKSGSWSITSEEDPRWNASGNVEFLSVWVMPEEAKIHLENCRKLYGKEPSDLEYLCMKD